MTGTYIDVAAGDRGGSRRAYLALLGPAGFWAVLLHTAFGLDRHMRDIADLYAAEGYVVLCPDLYGHIEPGLNLEQTDADRRKALALFERLDRDRAVADIASAAAVLHARPECTGKVGALGFCMGGGLAFAATAKGNFACAICYYPTAIEAALDPAPRIDCPMVLHFAENDDYVPAAAAAKTRGLLPAIRHRFYLCPAPARV